MTSIALKLAGIIELLDQPSKAGAWITVKFGNFSLTAKGEGMAYLLPFDKVVNVKVAYVDSSGNPATVDGPVVWDTSNPAVATVQADSGDSTLAVITPGTTLGQVQVSVTADADLGAGVRAIITVMDVEIVAGEAIAGTISPVGEPTPKP